SRGFPVSDRQKVYFGACYYRTVTVRGTDLGFGVNANDDGPGWWLRIDRPRFDGDTAAEELYRLFNGVLDSVEGLRGLRWQTEDEWHAEAEAHGTISSSSSPEKERAIDGVHP